MSSLARFALSIGAAALFAGCGALPLSLSNGQDDTQPPMSAGAIPQAPALAAPATSSNYKTLYSFNAPPDGIHPHAGLINVDGTLYGTTTAGGSYTCDHTTDSVYYIGACGTVFSITTGGVEKVLYDFGGPNDGGTPDASLLDVGGTLYGTTEYGGSNMCGYQQEGFGCGTVFSTTTGGLEKVLHNFGTSKDGVGPLAPLIRVDGTLYGTTVGGGANSCGLYIGGCGTVFSITTGGAESVLRSMRRAAKFPVAGLIDAGGTLYGTTYEGGADLCGRFYNGCGTVFSITLGGGVTVLHKFGRGTDGHTPRAGLIEVNGKFYGTTSGGGAHGDGTVFTISPAGREHVLYSFAGASDGSGPGASLIDVKGTLYGVTNGGGSGSGCGSTGCGTVFSITPGGKEKVLHSFGSASDGSHPEASLIDVKGTLYGTTYAGGTNGYGTVFALAVSNPNAQARAVEPSLR